MIIKRKLFAKISGVPRLSRNIAYRIFKKKSSPVAAAKKAVELGRKAEQAQVYVTTTTLGQKLADTVGFIGQHPAGTVIWAGTSFLPVPSTILSIGAEKAAQKVPIYRKATDFMKTGYNNSPIKNIITSAGNTLAAMPM